MRQPPRRARILWDRVAGLVMLAALWAVLIVAVRGV